MERFNVERKAGILKEILSGKTFKKTALEYGITASRIRVHYVDALRYIVRNKNISRDYAELRGFSNVKVARENSEFWFSSLDSLVKERGGYFTNYQVLSNKVNQLVEDSIKKGHHPWNVREILNRSAKNIREKYLN